ncbi:Centromere protein I [Caligus rogercresseyi]|uniref:Centromere protein I n=1 Tax=Caligus rogercresseyi TaxID=217165 RepID=A0A7T8H1R1_CALRO|nr:Centromere protein I [Caligus rogercresseyi]
MPSVKSEVLESVLRYIERSHLSSLLSLLIPSEAVSKEASRDLLLWCLSIHQESVYALVFRWIICKGVQGSPLTLFNSLSHDIVSFLSGLLNYSLLPLDGISPLYELLLRRLPTLSAVSGPYLLKILLRVTLARDVTPWRIHFMKIKSFSPYVRELLDHYWSLRPRSFDSASLELLGSAYVKVNWLYYQSKESAEMETRFAAVWKTARKDYPYSLLSEDAIFEMPSLHVYEPLRHPSEHVSFMKSKSALMNCFTMKDVYAQVPHIGLPDRALLILDSPQLYVLLLGDKESPLLIERLSLTLHETLVRDFMAHAEVHSREAEGRCQRNRALLRKIYRLQYFFQESLPVVNKFLAEYISSSWDGQSYFTEILKLLSLVQITDFHELFDCILQPLHSHLVESFSLCKKLYLMGVIKKLIVFWITYEVPRIPMDPHKPTVFPRANLTHVNPYKTLLALTSYFRDLVDLGLDPRAEDRDVFLREIFMMYKMISKVVLDNKFPLKPEPPISFCYLSLCSSNPLILNNLMEYIITLKNKVIPLLSTIAKTSVNKVDPEASQVASQQVKDSDFLNTVTKDILSVVSVDEWEEFINRDNYALFGLYRPQFAIGGCQRPFMFLEASGPLGIVPVLPVATPPLLSTMYDYRRYIHLKKKNCVEASIIYYLVRGKSIFREKTRDFEDEEYRRCLSIVTNLAFVRSANHFATDYSQRKGLVFERVIQDMLKSDSEAHKEYLEYLKGSYPSVVEFLSVFQTPRPKKSFNATFHSSSTSGVSSINSKRRCARNRKI